MIVVADTRPLNYLVLIEAVRVLQRLYGRVVVPRSVEMELFDGQAPEVVRDWIQVPPAWLEVHEDPAPDPTLSFLDAGERAALTLAEHLHADGLLIDERARGKEAARLCMKVTGTLGLLASAEIEGLLEFDAITRLRSTDFRLDPEFVEILKERIGREKRGLWVSRGMVGIGLIDWLLRETT